MQLSYHLINHSKSFWKILKDLVPKQSRYVVSSLNANNSSVSDPLMISEAFDKYFSNLASNFQDDSKWIYLV